MINWNGPSSGRTSKMPVRELFQLSGVLPSLGTVVWEWRGEGRSIDQNGCGMDAWSQVFRGLSGAREKKAPKRTPRV